MASKRKSPCAKRPYNRDTRQRQSDRRRSKILAVARAQLESSGFLSLTLDVLASESGVTRQTIHNLFGNKAGLLEALFDQLAVDGGMSRMREVMQRPDPKSLVESFVKVCTDFWRKDQLFIRRIHGIAAIDPELGAAVKARNRRRQAAVTRISQRLKKAKHKANDMQDEEAERIAAVCALTSFEFFDALAEFSSSLEDTAQSVLRLVKREFSN